jgi:hypothetical protein
MNYKAGHHPQFQLVSFQEKATLPVGVNRQRGGAGDFILVTGRF